MEKTPTGNLPSRSAPKSPSWVAERDALREWGDRKTRAILAIYQARRSAKKGEFFVHPDIAKVNRLTPGQLNWALDQLEGLMIETVQSERGRYRTIRLLPPFEGTAADAKESDGSKKHGSSHVSSGEERVHIDTAEVFAVLANTHPT